MSRIIKAGLAHFSEAAEPLADERPGGGEPPDDGEDPCAERAEQAVREAYDEIIRKASTESELLMERARDESRRIVGEASGRAEEARRSGYEEGYRAGLQEAREQTQEIIDRAERDAAELIAKAQAEHGRIVQETEPKLLRLALEVAEKIIHHELSQDDSVYMSILSSALGAVKAESQVVLRVNPSDYVKYFNSRETAKIRTANGNVTANITIDSTVGAGGCLIETDSGAIDSGPAAQIGQIANTLGVSYGEYTEIPPGTVRQ